MFDTNYIQHVQVAGISLKSLKMSKIKITIMILKSIMYQVQFTGTSNIFNFFDKTIY